MAGPHIQWHQCSRRGSGSEGGQGCLPRGLRLARLWRPADEDAQRQPDLDPELGLANDHALDVMGPQGSCVRWLQDHLAVLLAQLSSLDVAKA